MKLWFTALLFSFSTSPLIAVEPISATEASRMVEGDKAALVDVREMSELKETGLAQPAAWLAKSEIDAGSALYHALVKNWDRKKPLIFYCRSGKRSGAVALKLEKMGFRTYNMGAFDSWVAAGLPVVPFEQRR